MEFSKRINIQYTKGEPDQEVAYEILRWYRGSQHFWTLQVHSWNVNRHNLMKSGSCLCLYAEPDFSADAFRLHYVTLCDSMCRCMFFVDLKSSARHNGSYIWVDSTRASVSNVKHSLIKIPADKNMQSFCLPLQITLLSVASYSFYITMFRTASHRDKQIPTNINTSISVLLFLSVVTAQLMFMSHYLKMFALLLDGIF